MGGGGGAGKPKEPPLLSVRSVLHRDAANVKSRLRDQLRRKEALLGKSRQKRRGTTSLHVNMNELLRVINELFFSPRLSIWFTCGFREHNGEASNCKKSS